MHSLLLALTKTYLYPTQKCRKKANKILDEIIQIDILRCIKHLQKLYYTYLGLSDATTSTSLAKCSSIYGTFIGAIRNMINFVTPMNPLATLKYYILKTFNIESKFVKQGRENM